MTVLVGEKETVLRGVQFTITVYRVDDPNGAVDVSIKARDVFSNREASAILELEEST